jgi:hypothetical protein
VTQFELFATLPAGTWHPSGLRGAAWEPVPGAVPSLCAEWRSDVGGRVWLPCEPVPGCEGCATLAEHRCEP